MKDDLIAALKMLIHVLEVGTMTPEEALTKPFGYDGRITIQCALEKNDERRDR